MNDNKGCIVCGKEIKAKYLCGKHYQRFIKTGSVYLAKEVPDEKVVMKLKSDPSRLNLRQFI